MAGDALCGTGGRGVEILKLGVPKFSKHTVDKRDEVSNNERRYQIQEEK
jgi:hypothetical protein